LKPITVGGCALFCSVLFGVLLLLQTLFSFAHLTVLYLHLQVAGSSHGWVCAVVTLGKLLKPVCLCHQAV